MSVSRLIVVDLSWLIYRSFYALPPMSRADGVPVQAVLGVCNFLHNLHRDIERNEEEKLKMYVGVAFDDKEGGFRRKIFPDYKKNRAAPPDELKPQFDLVGQAVEAFGFASLAVEGFEADDIIASLVKKATPMTIQIESSDKDLLQLVSDRVWLRGGEGKRSDGRAVKEKFGIEPSEMVDFQALTGDISDNIPGVPGIGPKRAAALIRKFGSLDAILQEQKEMKHEKHREKILQYRKEVLLSRELVTLRDDVPLPSLDTLAYRPPDMTKMTSFLKQQGFMGLLRRIAPPELVASNEEEARKTSVCLLRTASERGRFLEEVYSHGVVAVLSDKKEEIVFATEAEVFALKGAVPEDIALMLEDNRVVKVGHGIGQVATLKNHQMRSMEDISVMSHCLWAGKFSHTLESLQGRFLKKVLVGNDEAGQQRKIKVRDILCLWRILLRQLLDREKGMLVYQLLDKPMVDILVDMERWGVALDRGCLERLKCTLHKALEKEEKEIFRIAGGVFNIRSPKQLGEVLFEKLGFKGGKRLSSGAYKTDSEVLEVLRDEGHEIGERLLEYRQLEKYRGTYVEGLMKCLQGDGRLHTTFDLTAVVTGRISSREPNVQNIPVRTKQGREIRKAFVAQKGWLLMAGDYSQIELRILAHTANVSELKEAFRKGEDIHQTTAQELFGSVTFERRRAAKAINFGIIYGLSAFGLSKQLSISHHEAKEYITTYFERYPAILDYIESTKKACEQQGYVSTFLGRRCYVPEIRSTVPWKKQHAQRAAINAPIQGGAADIMKWALSKLHKALRGFESAMVLQVHDEVVLEVPKEEVSAVASLLKETMEQVLPLSVPLVVRVSAGENWGEMKAL